MIDDKLKDETIENIFNALNVMESRSKVDQNNNVIFTHTF